MASRTEVLYAIDERSDVFRRAPPVAYLCGMYPTVSLTFILREIEALRAHGVEVPPCSIRRTPPSQHPGPLERAHAAETFNTLPELARPGRVKWLAGTTT